MSRATPLIRTISLVGVFLLAGVVGHARRANAPLVVDASAPVLATISSDAPDYSPGHTVTLTGGGWTPGETVTIVLHRDPFVLNDEVLTSVADVNGTITNTSFVPADIDAGVTFFVTATGSQSGLQATATFRATKPTWTGAVSTDWNTATNWAPSGVPDDRDDIIIPASVASGRFPIVNSPAQVKSILFETGGGTPSLTVAGSTLTVGGNFNVANTNAMVTQSGGTLAVTAGSITIAGTLNVSAGTFLTSVDIAVSATGRVNVSGTGTIHGANAIGAVPNDDLILSTGAAFTQSGGTVNTRDLTIPVGATYGQSGGILRVYHDFRNSGSFNATGGTIEFAGNGGSNAFNAPGTNQFFNVVVASGVTADFSSSVNAAILVRGDWTMNGTADLVARATTVTFNGSGPQTIGGTAGTTFRNLTVNKPAGTSVTLARTTTVTNGNVTVSSGTLDLAVFGLNRLALGGAFTVSDGAFLKLGGANSFPLLYAVHNLGPTSTVDYYGTLQSVSAESYGHLNLSTSSTKTMPATAMTIAGNFTMSGTASATAAESLTVNGNFTLGSGTTFGGASFGHFVKGNFNNSGTFNGGTSTFTFNGTSHQTIGGSNATTFNSLTIVNLSSVSLNGVNTTVNGVLTFTFGNVTTGPGQFIATSSTGSVSHGSGHVVGNLQKFVPAGAPVLTYEIGDSISYTPVTLAFANVSVPGNATGSTTTGDHPNGATSPIDPLKSVNRYWTWTSSGLGFTNYTATFTFAPGDIDPGANTNNFIVGKFTGGVWTTPTVGTRTPTSTQITGVTTFSDFEIGEGSRSTTLGNGVDPGNATLAPGGAATMAGAFTFQTDGGTDTVSVVTVTLAPGTSPAVSLVEITDDAGSIVYGSVADPASNIVAITLSTGITATTTSAQYKIRVTPKDHAAMPVPPGTSYALTAAVSAWIGSNGQAGSDAGGTTVTIDNLSPGNVTSATATSGIAQATLAWTNPADSDLATILVLRTLASAVVDTPTEGATYAVGNAIGSSIVVCVTTAPATGCTDAGLINGVVYHYKVFARDIDGNYATGVVPSGSPVTPNVTTLGNATDPGNATVAPGGAATMADAFTLQTAGGTDTITAVTVSLAPGTSAGVSHVEITNDAGTIVYGEVSNPVSDTLAIPVSITATTSISQYKIRITPRSHAAMPPPPGSLYTLTALVSSWTGTNAHAGNDSGGTIVTIDNLSSGNVTSATATSGDFQNTLAWTNPADGDLTTIVVLRQATSAVVDTPAEGVTIYLPGDAVGTSTVACVVTAPAANCTDAGLNNGTAYHYKIFARDANGNYATGLVPTGSPVIPTATVIGDGTPVSDATVAPGGAATMADAFTFQTATGTDAITAVTLALASGTSAGVSLVEVTDAAGTIAYGSVSNPSSDTFTVTLTTNIIATTTLAQYRIRVTPKSHAAMPAPPGASYALTAHITDWTGTNAHAGIDSGNTIITIDNLSPGNVIGAIATAGSTQVVLTGTRPPDSDLLSIVVLRRAGSAVADTPVEGATYSVGDTVGLSTVACIATFPAPVCVDIGLTNGTAYHYKTFARDVDGNYSTGVVPAGSPATPFAGVTVTPTSGLTTTEAGGIATFTVVLTSRPTADVTIGLSSNDTTEGTVSPSSLTFTSANWSVPQTVTVTGINDALDDGDIAYSIVTAAATSTDAGYNGFNVSHVTVTNTDNDTAGITVTPTSGLSTTEGGGTATFTVVLNTQPTADVTIGLTSSNTAEGTVSPASLTFTSANWNIAQTVTITGVNDAVADGNTAYTIVTAAATSGDASYNGVNPSDVAVTNIDNNTVGIIVNPSADLTTTEGGTAAFTVVLNSQPTADVTIALSSSDTTEGTVSAASLTFTSANWNVPQTVTITAVNDALDDGDIAYTVVTAAAVSSDGNYNGVNPSDVSVTNRDDDTSGITVSPTSGLTTTEAGGTATFTIVLTSQPTADVTIGLSSSNTAEGTVSPASVTFTPANWNVLQTVTVTGVDGPQVDGNVLYAIVTAPATSTDPNYSGRNAPDVLVINIDNDTAGITVTPTSGLTTTEAGGTATFTVVLTSQPAADVTIGVSSSDLTEGTVGTASLTFTPANWSTPQTVTITGVNNPVDDGDIAYTIVTAPAVSSDPDYTDRDAADVSVTNIDDDTAGIIVTPTSGLTTAEIFGTPATFTVVLTSQPTSNVVIFLSSSDPTEGSVSPVSLTFTSANWNVPQTVSVNGVNDVIIDGDIAYSIITAPATSGDPKYNGLDASDVSLTNIDSDTPTFFLTPTSGLTTTEAGGTATFTIVMNAQPSADVTVGLSSSNTNEGTVGPASVTFTSANWNIPRTVTVTGVNDFAVDGAIAYTIVTAPAISTDSNYNGVNAVDVAVTNIDNDAAGITVTPPSGLTTTEAGGTAVFTVVLNSQPTADVTIGLSSSNAAEGSISLASVTFTTANWNVPRTVTVTGVNDAVDDGDIGYTIVTAAATSADPNYAGVNASDVSMVNADDDSAGITVTPSNGLTTTEAAGAATFTIVLTAQPTADVTIALSSTDTTEGIVNLPSVTFTNANWSVPQTVTVTGVNDALDDGNVPYAIVTAAAISTDPRYTGVNAINVSVTNLDDDSAGITITPTAGLTTTEGGGTATFTVVLTSQPTADVVIGMTSSDTTEGTVSAASLTFTSGNWNVPQIVTVTGVNDGVDDGDIAYIIFTGPATSADAAYASFDPSNVLITNVDDEASGFTVTPTTGLVTTEVGGTATFTVVLNVQPTADVTIALSTSDPTEGTFSPASLTFTTANWNVPQTVTVTGVNDAMDDGDTPYVIVTAAATSGDSNYNGLNPSDVFITNTNDDIAGITVTPTSGLTTTEAGGTAAFTVVLTAQPTADVTIGLSSSNTAEGTVSAASLTFTTANWNVPQTVTVTGVNDALDDGDAPYLIITGAATSGDLSYNGRDASNVVIVNTDDDTSSIIVTPTAGLTTTEGLGTATFTVVLNAQPTADVVIALSSSDTTEGTVSPASLTFTPGNWNIPQTVTVTGVNDAVLDGNVAYTIVTAAATSTDPNYSGVNASDVAVSNTDDEVSADLGVTTSNGASAVTAGGTTTYTIVVSNAGPGGVVGATVTDAAPANVTFGAWTCAASPGSTCPASGTGDIAATVNLLAGGTATFTVAATISPAATGNVTNTATVSAPPGTIDPTPANNSASDTDSVGATADLSVTMTNGTTNVTAAGTTTYTIVVSNAGASAAGGAIVTSVGSGLAMTALACTATGGAVCPSSPTVAQLQAGLAIPTLPAGGSVSFTLDTIVTAISGTVSNTANVAPPSGTSDSNPANNSATDTDSVTAAALIADLVVSITDNMTVLVPGAVTVYTIFVSNLGPAAAAGATVTDTAPAGLTFGNWTCVASAGSSCVSGGTGNISTTVNLVAGGTATFTVPATVAAGAPASVAHAAVAIVPPGVTDPVPANNTATDVNLITPPQSMSLEIHAAAPAVVGPSAFEVSYTVDVRNTGVNPLTNLQIADSLSSAFAEGAPTIAVIGAPAAARQPAPAITATAPCVANTGFTGIGSESDPGTQLLSGSPSLGVGQGCTIEFRVRLTYPSAAVLPTAPQSNRVSASTSLGVVTIASAADEASVLLLIPRVDVTKMLTSVKQLDNAPVFDISYAIVLRNTSQAAAANVQVTDNLAATFAPGAPVITVVSGPVIESGNGSLTLATGANAFNGTTRTAMLIGSDTMAPGAENRIGFTVRVSYASGAVIPVGVDLNNSAIATTSATPGGTVITRDESTDVTDSGAPPQASDTPDPTKVRLEPRAQLSVQKLANVLVAEIGDTVQYAVRVRNVTGPTLPQVALTDRLPLGFRYVTGSARLGVADAAQPLPDPAGGVGPVLTFAIPAQAERAEALITYRVRIGAGALQGDGVNRAEAVSGDIRSNTAVARVLVSGGVFTTDACVIGAIFVDLNGNGVQDAGEPGVPDVALHFEEGTSIVTDLQGKYSYCGLMPTTHVLKVDSTTLPAGATLATSGNRNAGSAGSLFVDLKFGEVHRADFIVDGRASQAVLDEVGHRRARAEAWVPKFDEPARTGVSGGRPATGTGAAASVGVAGGFEPIRQATGLNPANSNAPEPLPAALEPPPVNGVVAPSALPPSATLRQMLLVGLLDGAVSFSKVDGGLLAPARPEAVFDREFRRFTGSFDNGQGQYGGRGALFVKGTIATHYLMTFAYDSDKDVRSALFRDIQPEAFYPIYGDGSEKRFDAQTSGRFYARVDRGHSYLMYGDLQTSSFSPEAQALGAYNRALTGVQQHFENSRMVVNLFASHDSLRQVIDEYAARGISGPYPVSNPNGVSGTERVEIITRDRNQPALVLSAVRLTRFTDYEFEPFSGRLLFRMPVPSLDEQLNPVSIRVTYEVDAGGDKSWVGGGNVQMKFGSAVQIGGSWIEDGTPGSPYRLISANTTLRLGKSSTFVIEAAQSTGTINTGLGGSTLPSAADVDAEGLAARIEWRHTSSHLIARAFGAFSDPGFNNPASTLAGGRTEAGGRARWTITKGLSFIGEAIHSEDRLTGGRRDGGLVTLETKWKPLVFEVGMRRASETGAPSQGTSAGVPLFGSGSASGFGFGSTDNRIDPVTGQPIVQPGFGPRLSAGPNAPATVESPDVMTVRAKLTVLIGKRANIYGEAEQDVRSAERRVAAIGTQLKFNDKVKLYARHEFISSLDGPYALTDGQRSYNTVFGVASTYMKDGDLFSEYRLGDAISGREAEAAIGLRNHWALAKGVRLSTGFERVQSIAGASREASAVSAGLEYTASARLKGTGRIEWRQDSASDSWLSTVGIAQRLSRDWTMLARNYYQLTVPKGAPNLVQDRVSIGAAYRDTAKNRLNLLTRYEFRIEDTAGLTIGTANHRQVQVVSTHVDVHPLRAWTFSGQHALKFVDDRSEISPGRFGTQLVSGRVGYDIARRWDIGALTSVMWGGESGRRSAVGAEVGFQIRQGLWLSGGYNFTGFTDRDLVSSNFTTRGVFMRIRVKFDESIVPAAAKGGR